MYELTLFKTVYDNKTHRYMSFDEWNQFVEFLKKCSLLPYKEKSDAALMSPSVYKPKTKRSNRNVVYWGKWAALDVDDVPISPNGLEDDLRNRFKPYNFICYNTASSSMSKPKFRVVFELEAPVNNEDIKKFWWALNSEFSEIGDKQTKDLSRMYYVPGKYDGAFDFFFTECSGIPLSVIDLIKKHPMPEKHSDKLFDKLPEDMQSAIIQHKKDSMKNVNFSWNSYTDCPFLNKSVLEHYIKTTLAKDSGRYRAMFNIMLNVASNAMKSGYPITPNEIGVLCRQLDQDTGLRYETRAFETEAQRAIKYAFTKAF